MGKYYALAQGEDAAVAARDRGSLPTEGAERSRTADPVSIAVALADKIDTLVGFWFDRREANWKQRSICADAVLRWV